MKKLLALASIPVLALSLSGCSFSQAFGGNCDSLKINVENTLDTLSVIDGEFSGGLPGKQQSIWGAGYENINAWVAEMVTYNGNLRAVIDLDKTNVEEVAVLTELLDDLDEGKFILRLASDDEVWYYKTKADLNAVAKICGF